MKVNEIREAIKKETARSAWDKGVKVYALELLDELNEAITGKYFDESDIESPNMLKKQLLNGASSWQEYNCHH